MKVVEWLSIKGVNFRHFHVNIIYVNVAIAASVAVLKIVKNICLCNHKTIDRQKSDLLLKPIICCFELRESGERPLQKTTAVIPTLIS